MKHTLVILSLAACTGTRDPITPSGDVATIRVFEEGTGAQGRIAIFQDRRGAVRTQVRTGSDGRATSSIRAGDMVTLANVGAPKFDLITYVDLQPSDLAVVGEIESEDQPQQWGSLMQVALPAPPQGAMHGEVGGGLALTPHPGAPTAVRLVDTDGAFHVVGIATDESGAPVAFTTLELAANAQPAMVTLPAWRTDWHRVDVRVANVSPSAQTHVAVDAIAGHARFPALAAPDQASTLLLPAGVGQEMDTQITITDNGARRTWRRVGELASSVRIDTTDLLPAVSQVSFTPGARPTVTWNTGAVDASTVAVIRLSWGEGDAHRWTVIAPASIRRFEFPALPDELALWRPTTEVRVGVGLIHHSEIAGYHALMQHGIDELEAEDGETLRTSTYGYLKIP